MPPRKHQIKSARIQKKFAPGCIMKGAGRGANLLVRRWQCFRRQKAKAYDSSPMTRVIFVICLVPSFDLCENVIIRYILGRIGCADICIMGNILIQYP